MYILGINHFDEPVLSQHVNGTTTYRTTHLFQCDDTKGSIIQF